MDLGNSEMSLAIRRFWRKKKHTVGNPCLDSWPSSESADASEKSEQSGRTAAVAAGLSMSVRIT